MSDCCNPTCDTLRAAALQAVGAWDALLEASKAGDAEAGEAIQRLADAAPHLADALQVLSEGLADAA